jgi:hypothetical protein
VTSTADANAHATRVSLSYRPNGLLHPEPCMTTTIANLNALPKVRRVRVYTRLSHPLRKRLAAYCAASGRSERAVIEDAVYQYLDGRSDSSSTAGPIERLVEAIDRDRQRREQQQRDVEVLSESLGRFLRLWMVVHASTFRDPATPAAADALTKQLAAGEDLYRRLAGTIAQHFMKGHRFVQDVLRVEQKAQAETADKP